jgi:DNA modification methylase
VTATDPPRRLEYLRLDEIQHAPRNPKGHDLNSIGRSVAHHGFVEVPAIDTRTGRLVAGHGRHEQLTAMHAAGQNPPDGVLTDDDGMWRMPVITGWASRSDIDAEAYLVASNQITTAGGWGDGLPDVLHDIQAAGLTDLTGFTDDQLEELLTAVNENPFGWHGTGTPADADDTDPEPPDEPVSQLGDVWVLGEHRLICGDSTSQDVWAELMQDEAADCVWTDPPYGVAYVMDMSPEEAKRLHRRTDGKTVMNDGLDEKGLDKLVRAALGIALTYSRAGACWYVAAPPGPLNLIFGAYLHEIGVYRQQLIWVKDQFAFGRSDYHYRHEPIFYGWKPGAAHQPVPDRTQDTVWEIPRPKRSEDHPTMKPVELVTRALTNSTTPGAVVIEPFSGSGTTLLACQITGRRGRAIELDPRYVDVAARRWQELTGDLPFNERLSEPVDLIGRQL